MIDFDTAATFCDRVFDETHATPKPSESGYRLVTSKNITGGHLDLSDTYYISEDDYNEIQKRSYVSQWDVLFSMIGSVGEVYIEKDSTINYAVKNVGVFSCRDEIRAKWLYYYLKSNLAKQIISNQLSGAVQKFLGLGALRSFPIQKFDERKRKGVELLSTLDAKIALNRRLNAELEAMAKLLYDYWFVQFDFPISAAQATAMGKPNLEGKPYRASGGQMVYNEQLKREIPEGWEVAEVVAILAREQQTRKILNSLIHESGSIPVIDQSSAFICGFTDDSECVVLGIPKIVFGDHTRVVKFVNFLFARGADGTQLLSSRDARVPPHLFYQQIRKFDLSSYGYARHFKFLKQQKVVLPSLSVASAFEGIASKYFCLIRNNTFENIHLTQLRDWLLPMLMNGKVTVGDPNSNML